MEEFDPSADIAERHAQQLLDHAKREKIEFGLDVERWFESKIGHYCTDKAAREEAQLLEELTDVDPNNTKEIIRIQQSIQVRRCWQGWLAEAISEGLTAQQQAIEQGHL